MFDVEIRKVNNVFIQVIADASIRMGMSEHFARYVRGYQFQPKYKAKVWDGKIRFFQYQNGFIYCGLIKDVLEYCKEGGLKVRIDDEVKSLFDFKNKCSEYIDGLELSAHGNKIEFRDYQKKAIVTAISQKRKLIQSPTSSGKSSIIYGITRYLLDNVFEHERILIVVPTIGLVTQLKSDFKDYSTLNGWDADEYVGLIGGGRRDDQIERFRIHLDDGSSIDVTDQTRLQLKSGKTKTIKRLKENDEIDDEWLSKLKNEK